MGLTLGLEVSVVAEDRRFQMRLVVLGLLLGITGNMMVEYYMRFLDVFEVGWAENLFLFIVAFWVIIYFCWRLSR